jgi:aspartate aminotransferase
VAERYRLDCGLAFAPGEVAIGCGGKQSLFNVCQVLLNRGDEVIIPTPYWPTFTEVVRLTGARPVLAACRERDNFEIRASQIRRAVGPRTRAVILNSPNNPTGAVIDPEQLMAIGRLAQRFKLTLLYDDTYAQLRYGPASDAALPALRRLIPDRFVVVGTASKTYCMTGWRIGWALGPRPMVDACAALASHSTQSPATFAQYGAVAALSGSQQEVCQRAAEYRVRRDVVYAALEAIRGVSCVRPAGAFYVFPNVTRFLSSEVPTSLALASRLLAEQHVASVPGEGFGAPGHLRISFARPLPELETGAARIRRFLEAL